MDLNPMQFCCRNLSCPQNEIDTVLNLGVVPDRIIYANPCKLISHLRFAADKGVEMLTFDSESELYKIKKYFPGAKQVDYSRYLLLRWVNFHHLLSLLILWDRGTRFSHLWDLACN